MFVCIYIDSFHVSLQNDYLLLHEGVWTLKSALGHFPNTFPNVQLLYEQYIVST